MTWHKSGKAHVVLVILVAMLLASNETLQESNIKLCIYSGEKLEVKGSAICKVEYHTVIYKLPVVILAGNGPTLLGCSWLYHIPIQWTKLLFYNDLHT